MNTRNDQPTSPGHFSPKDDDPNELGKLQLDYAWKWFSFHADQRTKMFNYMLALFGLFAAAIATTLDKPGMGNLTPWLCWLAALLALIFALIDTRNRTLVWFGEDVLISLEKEFLFGVGEKARGRRDKEFNWGILNRQQVDEAALDLKGLRLMLHDACRGKHRFWMPGVALLMCAAFVAAGWWTYTRPAQPVTKPPLTTAPPAPATPAAAATVPPPAAAATAPPPTAATTTGPTGASAPTEAGARKP